jgi:phosphatidylglycerol:prolipoprotein diacylglycerol transferase
VLLLVWLPAERRKGDVAGLGLMGSGLAIYITELWRDPTGRGSLLHGALDGPQIAAILLVIAGALVLREPQTARPSTDEAADEAPAAAAQQSSTRGPA